MRIKFIDGERVSTTGLNYTVYINAGTINPVYGCYTYKAEKDTIFFRRYFAKNRKDLEYNTIYVVRQSSKIEQFRTLLHELAHWLTATTGNWKIIHKLIDKYL